MNNHFAAWKIQLMGKTLIAFFPVFWARSSLTIWEEKLEDFGIEPSTVGLNSYL
jgi:hypothetical protein